MAFQILVNLIIAVTWTFLQNSFTATSFLFGYIIGIIILFILRRFLVFNFYMNRVWAIIKLIMLFIIELIKANIDVVKIVLSPKLNNQPGIVAVETRLESEVEITLLAALISLTPGTVSMDFSADGKTIYIHSIDVPDKEDMIDQIQNSFERAIMEVTK
ncbi:Na+/H+ antiporter subunit E [Oceanobacillus polygoni]|uniref:Multicomponent Na+:H+ antiporter subunit E n=1 Tax=Oceanobacillus polygoni TaxID=1235259 RepID=A0A9X1CHV0_9BACI|nr:Na+/H+ antiporter subunit E [Oceanobacillus polygoni]MBP2078118.1 multicomponent Na+:H+ antiporter subunit E [Oceanobacillus polygoni]